jgi:hypothetical protein
MLGLGRQHQEPLACGDGRDRRARGRRAGGDHRPLGKGGTVMLYLDGEQVGEGAVAATAAMIFSFDDTCDVGKEDGALVAEDCPVPTSSRVRSTGSRSTSATPPSTPTTDSIRTSCSASRWRASSSARARRQWRAQSLGAPFSSQGGVKARTSLVSCCRTSSVVCMATGRKPPTPS